MANSARIDVDDGERRTRAFGDYYMQANFYISVYCIYAVQY